MRTLADAANTAKNADSGSPINLLRLALPSGAVYYSDRDIRIPGETYVGKVMSWGSLSYAAHEDGHASTTLTGLVFADPDKTLLASLEAVQWQRIPAQIYQGWTGVHDDDKVLLLDGIITGPLAWDENERTLTLDIIDVATKWDMPIGTLATKEVCPDIAPEDEGRMIPIAYGEGVKKVKAIAARVGRHGRLLRDCDVDDTTLYVEGWEDKTPGTELNLRIGDEVVVGNIYGIQLRNVVRGNVVTTGRTTADQSQSEFQSILTTVSGFDAQYNGLWLKVHVPKDTVSGASLMLMGWPNQFSGTTSTVQHKRIIGFDGSTGRISWEGGGFVKLSTLGVGSNVETAFWGPIVTCLGEPFWFEEGQWFEIVSVPAAHSAGEEVVENIIEGIAYILADHPCLRVRGIYVKGDAKSSPGSTEQGQGTMPLLSIGNALPPASQQNTPVGESTGSVKEGWRMLSSRDYHLYLNDSDVFPALGHPVTVLLMPSPPSFNRNLGAKSEEIWADLDGAYVDTTLIQHPLDVAEDIATDYGPGAGDLDASITGAAVKDLTRHLRVRFALTEQRALMDICAHLAFLCRCRLYVTDAGLMAAQYLTHWGDVTRATVDDDKIALDSLVLGWRELEELITRLKLSYQEHGFVRHKQLDDTAEQATYGVRQREIDLAWLADEDMASWMGQFWLDRWKRVNRIADLATPLHTLELQVGDQIDLFRAGILDTAPLALDTAPAIIDAITQEFGDGAREMPDLIRHHVRLPLWPGCPYSCESECQSGCESQCEVHCQSVCQTGCEESCQTDCQAVCEMACETALELVCPGSCQTSCTIGCENSCTGSNMIAVFTCEVEGCETTSTATCAVCDQTCDVSCRMLCQSTCRACETACQNGGGCETLCQTISCELGCQIDGEGGCATECEIGACQSQEVCAYCCQQDCTGANQSAA